MKSSIITMVPRRTSVILAIQDGPERDSFRTELESLGHRVLEWKQGEPIPPAAVVAVASPKGSAACRTACRTG